MNSAPTCCLALLAACQVLLCCGFPARAAPPRPSDVWPPVFTEDFSAGARRWETTRGAWRVVNGEYAGREEGPQANAMSYCVSAPVPDVQRVAAKLTVHERLQTDKWSFAGIVVFQDLSSFWLLALTEGPNGRRYVDFLENYGGKWQAQNSGATRLASLDGEGLRFSWEYGVPYRLRLELDGEGVEAQVLDGARGQVLASRRYDFGGAKAVRSGMAGLLLRGCAAAFDDMVVRAPSVEVALPAGLKIERGESGTVAVLKDELPGLDASAVDHVVAALRRAGFGVTFLSAGFATDPGILRPEHFRVYLVPNARVYPYDGRQALVKYLRRRGNLVVLGGPAFETTVWPCAGRWLERKEIRALIAKTDPDRIIFDFERTVDLSGWTRQTDNADAGSTIEVVAGGPDGAGKCLEIRTEDFSNWNTYASPRIEGLFPEGCELLCFQAKGDADTPQLSVEMNETDGARWIAVVPLTEAWTRHVLAPDDFAYWPDSKTGKERGQFGDRFRPEAAATIVFGLARSHTRKVGAGAHTFRIDDVGAARHPFPDLHLAAEPPFLPLESIWPPYKLYPLENVASLEVEPGQRIVDAALRLPVPASVLSPFARPRGKGFGAGGKWRWIPLVNCLDKDGVKRGVAMWMLLHRTFPFSGAATLALGVADQTFVKGEGATAAIVRATRRLSRGLFLAEAGAQHFSYWPGETAELGAEIVNTGPEDAAVTVRFAVSPRGGAEPAFVERAELLIKSGEEGRAQARWRPARPGADSYVVKTELLQAGAAVDAIEHEIGVLSDARPAPGEFVTAKGADFYVNGGKWRPVGVNFWPLHISALEPGHYRAGWLAPGLYDPAELERDLVRMAALGVNMVSTQLGPTRNVRNVLDFLRRCGRHGIKVFGFLEAASPVRFQRNALTEFIQSARLTDNPNLFAYDIIWEPGNWVFRQAVRDMWDSDWEAWIEERYGGLAAAEADWGFPAPRKKGKVSSPSDPQMQNDGPWRVMVAAYRRFMDDLMSRKWNDAVRELRRLDPNHLVSFRQGNTLSQDFTLTATPKHTDFICPEGYTIWLGEDGYNAASFITRYVNFTTRGKPIVWSEFGISVWDRAAMRPRESEIERQAEYHEMLYRMAIESGATGTAPWWWPGGYRVDERSDYGICNPDGTPRPAALVLRKYAPQLKDREAYPEPNEWLTVDRDAHPGGYWRIAFNEGKDAYGDAWARGRMLGVRTTGTGTTSANAPLLAVGNTPYSGSNPPKYLNAEFNWFRIRNADGQWADVAGGAEIAVARGAPVLARASVGNTQEAAWVAPAGVADRKGAVYLASRPGSDLFVKQPVPQDTPYLADADLGEFVLAAQVPGKSRVILQMTAEGRAWFGGKLSFTLTPRP